MSELDAETRRKFIDELTQTKSPEEIGIKLADMTKALANKSNEIINEKNDSQKIEENKVADESAKNKAIYEDRKNEVAYKEEENEEVSGSSNNEQLNEKTEEYKLGNSTNVANDVNKKEEETFEQMYKRLFGRDINEAKKEYAEKQAEEEEKYPISPITGEEISIFEKEGIDNNPQYKFIGIAFKTYIILTINPKENKKYN